MLLCTDDGDTNVNLPQFASSVSTMVSATHLRVILPQNGHCDASVKKNGDKGNGISLMFTGNLKFVT